MTVEAIPGNCGLVGVTISAKADTPTVRAAKNRRQSTTRGKVSAFSRRSRTRLRTSIDEAAIPTTRAAVLTLEFPAGTDPQAAKLRLYAFERLARKRLPGVFGWHRMEWKAFSGKLHFHLLLCAPAFSIVEVMALRAEFAAKFAELSYMAPLNSLRGLHDYISKLGPQSIPPAKFIGRTGRHWGTFGAVPRLTGRKVTLPEAAQTAVRRAVAATVARQGGRRSEPYACAVEESVGKIRVLLTPAEAARVLNPLVVDWTRSVRACPAKQSLPSAPRITFPRTQKFNRLPARNLHRPVKIFTQQPPLRV